MRRHPASPVLTRLDIPELSPLVRDVSSVFNPGAARVDGRTLLLLRVQTRGRETVLVAAESDDGVSFTVHPRILSIEGLDELGVEVFHVYDPRLTLLEDRVYVVFSADTPEGCRLGIARMRAEHRLDLVSFSRDVDSRNGVLFPEKVGGRYLRLERPNLVRLDSGVRTGSAIHLAESDDLVDWRITKPVLAGRPHYWDELIGSGPPPLKTREGWLHVYHGVATHFASANVYQAGVCLLDLEDPARVVARGRNNILEPRETWEMVGQVPNVVFPTGMIADDVDEEGFALIDSPVRIYYGAADTVVGLAESTVRQLLDECALS